MGGLHGGAVVGNAMFLSQSYSSIKQVVHMKGYGLNVLGCSQLSSAWVSTSLSKNGIWHSDVLIFRNNIQACLLLEYIEVSCSFCIIDVSRHKCKVTAVSFCQIFPNSFLFNFKMKYTLNQKSRAEVGLIICVSAEQWGSEWVCVYGGHCSSCLSDNVVVGECWDTPSISVSH